MERSATRQIDEVLVGHWTDRQAQTGCTVVILPEGCVGSGEVRGGAPATRDFALLDPVNTVCTVDAVVLSGGSAFGLASGDGVMRWLEEQGRGFETAFGPIPIVVGMSLFDLGVGDPSVRPGPAEGYLASSLATKLSEQTPHEAGLVGAGTGATVGKWFGPAQQRSGGLGVSTVEYGEVIVRAIVAVNAFGFIDDDTTPDLGSPPERPELGTNTTIGVVVTNAIMPEATFASPSTKPSTKSLCFQLAQSAHNGLARAIIPSHTAFDGDAFVAATTAEVEADPVHLRLMAQESVEQAIRSVSAEECG